MDFEIQCINVYHIITGAHAYLKFINLVRIKIFKKLKTNLQHRELRRVEENINILD